MKINYNILLGCLIISIGIIMHGYITGQSYDDFLEDRGDNAVVLQYKEVLNLTEVAEYLNMTESEVKAIIRIESNMLRKNHGFSGIMLPYFQVDEKYYFYKKELDRWLTDSTRDMREYDIKKGFLLH